MADSSWKLLRGFLEKGTNCTQVFVSQLSEKVDPCYEYELAENHAFKVLQ